MDQGNVTNGMLAWVVLEVLTYCSCKRILVAQLPADESTLSWPAWEGGWPITGQHSIHDISCT